jgi:cytochrome c biogenesis protein CcdA
MEEWIQQVLSSDQAGITVLIAVFVMGLFSFSLGYGLPLAAGMIGLGLGLGKISNMMARFGTIIKYTGGIAMLIIGFYFLITV